MRWYEWVCELRDYREEDVAVRAKMEAFVGKSLEELEYEDERKLELLLLHLEQKWVLQGCENFTQFGFDVPGDFAHTAQYEPAD